jgi:hypothetical protein
MRVQCVIGFLTWMLVGFATTASAQLAVTVSPLQVTGQKAVVPLSFTNGLPEKITSARAALFLLDEHGKMLGQATHWVLGAEAGAASASTVDKSGLPPGATNAYHFVVTAIKPLTSTNLTAKVQFTRIVLEGGKLADINKDVTIRTGAPPSRK